MLIIEKTTSRSPLFHDPREYQTRCRSAIKITPDILPDTPVYSGKQMTFIGHLHFFLVSIGLIEYLFIDVYVKVPYRVLLSRI